jgi:type IV secretory pathway VirJ component
VYATLAQAPDNTFRGAISLSLCPSLVLRKEPCPRNGLASQPADRGSERRLEPVTGLPTPWIVLQGDIDEVCPADSAEAFVRQVPGAELVTLPKVGHGFSVTRRWAPQFEAAADRLQEEPPSKPAAQDTLPGLPLVELIPPTVTSDYFAIILSGDGGWASIDKKIGEELAKNGVPVVGFNSLKYFWGKQRTAAEVGADLGRIIEHFTEAWHKESVIVIGYSRGADVLPVMANNLPPGLIDRVKLLTFVGLEHETNLKFHMGDWLHSQHHAEFQLLPEVQRLKGTKMLCIYGDKEKDTLCPELEPDLAEVVKLEGGHHLDGDYPALTRLILARVP